MSSESPNPYSAPETPGEDMAAPTGPTDYATVPALRRNGVCSGIIVAHLVIGFIPYVRIFGILTTIGVIAVCISVLTGPVYYNKHNSNGTLQQWSNSNKVAAVILLILFVGGYAALMYMVATKA